MPKRHHWTHHAANMAGHAWKHRHHAYEAYNHWKKHKTKTEDNPGPPGEVVDVNAQAWRRSKSRAGRFKVSWSKLEKKLVSSAVQTQYWRLQGLQVFDTATATSGGYFNINSTNAGLVNQFYYPLYLMDVTATPNVSTNGVVVYPGVMWRLTVDDRTTTTGNYSFVGPANLQDKTGATYTPGINGTAENASQWQPENLPHITGIVPNYPGQRELLSWVQAKFLLYAPKNRPTRFLIQYVQLEDDWLCPDWTPGTGLDSSTYVGERNAFWNAMSKPWCNHPLNSQDPKLSKKLKVIRTVLDCVMEPKLTTEPAQDATTTVGHMRTHVDFYKMNRKCVYDWNDSVQTYGDAVQMSYQQDKAINRSQVHPKARVFLMIRALSQYNNLTATLDPRFEPSFDLVLRKKTVHIA